MVQINSFGPPIFKKISEGASSFGFRQINTAGKGAIYKPIAAFGYLKSVANFTTIFAVACDLARIGAAVAQDVAGNSMSNTVHAVAEVGGTWGGIMAGTSVGATVGSVVPVVGTFVGGLAGGIVGASYGASTAIVFSDIFSHTVHSGIDYSFAG